MSREHTAAAAPGHDVFLWVTYRGTGMAEYRMTPQPGESIGDLRRRAKARYCAEDDARDPSDYGTSWQYVHPDVSRRAVSALRDLAAGENERAARIRAEVAAARAMHVSWRAIGEALCVSAQAAQQRYG